MRTTRIIFLVLALLLAVGALALQSSGAAAVVLGVAALGCLVAGGALGSGGAAGGD